MCPGVSAGLWVGGLGVVGVGAEREKVGAVGLWVRSDWGVVGMTLLRGVEGDGVGRGGFLLGTVGGGLVSVGGMAGVGFLREAAGVFLRLVAGGFLPLGAWGFLRLQSTTAGGFLRARVGAGGSVACLAFSAMASFTVAV